MFTYTDLPMADILPHKDPMILVDKVMDFQDDFIHVTLSIRPGIPFYNQGKVPSYIALEYMAQAVAAWNGLILKKYNQPPRIGFLLGTRKLTLDRTSFKEGELLNIYGRSKYSDGEMASFECWIDIEGKQVALASLNVFQPQAEGKLP